MDPGALRPSSLASGGLQSLGNWADPKATAGHPLTWALTPRQPPFLSQGSEVPVTTTGLLNLVFFPAGARGTSPGEQVLLMSPPTPPRPETQQLSRWLEDFSSHATLSGVGEGGQAAGFLVSQARSPWGPARMWAPTPVGGEGGEAATAPCVPREAWEGGSLCPAHQELTHRVPDGGAALGSWRTRNVIGGGGHKTGPLA